MRNIQSRIYWLLAVAAACATVLAVATASAQANGIELISPAEGEVAQDNEPNTVHFQFTTSGSCSNSHVLMNGDGAVDPSGRLTDGSPSPVPVQAPGQPCTVDLSAPTGRNYWQAYGSDCGGGGGTCMSVIRVFYAPVWLGNTYTDDSTVSWERPPEPPDRSGTPAPSPTTQRDTVAPTISSLNITGKFALSSKKTATRATVSKKKVKKGAVIRYTLSEAATVQLSMEKKLKGLKLKQKDKKGTKTKRMPCVSSTKKNKRKLTGQIKSRYKKKKLSKKKLKSEIRKASCTFYKKDGMLTRSGIKGTNKVSFSGRIGKRKLARGSYRLVATAKDSAGNASNPKRKRFQVVKVKKKKAKKKR